MLKGLGAVTTLRSMRHSNPEPAAPHGGGHDHDHDA